MPRTRLTAEERQGQLLTAAIATFSIGGYAGTTTDQEARLAGVSQPYVIRIFRTKQELFIAAMNHAGDRIEERFRTAAAEEATLTSLGEAYGEMLSERELITLLLHGFTASTEPAIGEAVRACFGRLYQVVRDLTGATTEEVWNFFGTGMLLTCLVAMGALGPDEQPRTEWASELMERFDDPE
jgi:AcrR family transcriptional regulator